MDDTSNVQDQGQPVNQMPTAPVEPNAPVNVPGESPAAPVEAPTAQEQPVTEPEAPATPATEVPNPTDQGGTPPPNMPPAA